ncbi:nuclear transport factor 2 family protein, partial [uncultured Tateyamaria sp.]
IVFRSHKAMRLVGTGELRGKAALRAYWTRALEGQPDLSFVVVDVLHGHGMLVITYRNQRDVLAAETLRFGPDGLVIEASACHKP